MRSLKTRRQWVTVNADPSTPKRLTGFSVAEVAMTCSGNIVSVTTTRRHWMNSGDRIVVEGASIHGYNGERIVRVTSITAFQFDVERPLAEQTGASFYVKKPIRDATLLGKKTPQGANTGSVHIGVTPEDASQAFEIAAGGEYYLEPPADEEWDLADWWLDVDTADDGLVIFFS